MPEQITITLMDDGSVLLDNGEAAVAWHQKTGKYLAIGITDDPKAIEAFANECDEATVVEGGA